MRTQGFLFNESSDGVIKVTTSDYQTLKGGYGCSAVSNKATTPLDGLSVAITPDEFDSINDAYAGNSISIIWSEDTTSGNKTPVSRVHEVIDLSDGLYVNVRADDRLGYIVNVNGYDYYRGDEMAYFPDCNTDMYAGW
ncbi:MAG: hypothetical protein IKT46_00275 [Clostridia bacterium]|nr:hypothetical protein [Clostridia bacterium]